MPKITFTVTNDLVYDQRMERICSSLHNAGYEVELIGRLRDYSKNIEKPYKNTRIKLLFNQGKLFYLEYNIRLFCILLFKKTDILCAIDLDTILPNFFVSKIRKKPLVYDSHEYFTEVIELTNRPRTQKIWVSIEQFIVPKLKYAYTVNQSIADIYFKKYKTPFSVIRNAARLDDIPEKMIKQEPYLLYIGAVNEGRGLKEIILAMKEINMKLIICGEGDLYQDLQQLTIDLKLTHKIEFKGFIQPKKLKEITANAFLGYLLLEKESLSYYYSLANKFYDYIHAEIPQITSNFPEYQSLNEKYNIAKLINLNVDEIISTTNNLISDQGEYQTLKKNTKKAKQSLNWNQEENKLISYYNTIK